MADFQPAFDAMIRHEGGFILHEVRGDRGGKTYAGIAQNYHPQWQGWPVLERDTNDPALPGLVQDFYKQHFWDRIKGDDLDRQIVATAIFDFAVNAGVGTAAKLAQKVAGATADGVIGTQSVAKLNALDPALFMPHYTLAKIQRYADIVNRDRGQKKFLLGWVNRSLEGLG